jgi:hypothetical protein
MGRHSRFTLQADPVLRVRVWRSANAFLAPRSPSSTHNLMDMRLKAPCEVDSRIPELLTDAISCYDNVQPPPIISGWYQLG